LDGFRKSLSRFVETRTPAEGADAGKALEAAAVERLRSLGYLAGPAAPKKRVYGPEDDVKVLLPFHNKSMEALDLSRRGDTAAGIRQLREVITERPDMDVAYVNLALLFDHVGRLDDAVRVLEGGLEAAPESYDVLSHLVRFLVATRRYREALDVAESHSLPQMEQDPKIWVDLGICHRNLGDPGKARAAYEAALGIDPTYAVIHNNLGTLDLSLHFENPDGGFLERALASFEKAVGLDPAYAAAWYGLGQSRYQAREYETALGALEKSLKLKPDLADALFYLGMSFFHEGRFAEALPPLQTYRERVKDSLLPADLKKLDEVIESCREKK
jgi:tetratricopeptide (TPR) repeat protein